MTPISVRARADADIDGAVQHYLDEDPRAAARFIDELENTFRRIARNPGLGSPRFAEITAIDGLRSLSLNGFGYHVFYIETAQRVAVIRVLHERRDIAGVLADSRES